MFRFLSKSPTKSARRAKAFSTAARRGLFETLETRRVFAASLVATDANIFFDAEGGTAPNGQYTAGTDQVTIMFGDLNVVGTNNVVIEIALYEDTESPLPAAPGTFGVFDYVQGDEAINSEVLETSSKMTVFSDDTVGVGVYDLSGITFTAPAAGSYWVVVTASDGDGNVALGYFFATLEVVGDIGGELPTIAVAGSLVHGTQVDFTASNANLSGTWLVTFDSDDDGIYETSLGDVADDATYSFTPTIAGDYRVEFETALGIASSTFTVTQGILVGDEYVVVAPGPDQPIDLSDVPAGATTVTINALSGNGEVIISDSVTVPVTVVGGTGDDELTITSTSTAPVTIEAGDGNDAITITGDTTAAVTISGGLGNDTVYISSSASGTVTVNGGEGNDIIVSSNAPAAALFASLMSFSTASTTSGTRLLVGGSGDDILVGGSGSDIIVGGAGRDLLIGGDGSDLLVGSAADDILIAGIADWTVAELTAVRSLWTGAGTTAQRISLLLASYGGLFDSVVDDDDTDVLVGAAGTDWFFANREPNGLLDGRDLVLDLSWAERSLYEELD